jgi:glycosyltransferase involved in cell wall biosynthesis
MIQQDGGEVAVKVLLSAFACEPNVGSEFSVGWNWALSLARAGHQVAVLTRQQSRPGIERVLTPEDRGNLRFEYVDVPPSLRWESRGPLHVHYALWQCIAIRHARRLHRQENFDRVHHVTYAGLRAPSLMGRLGIPFIFGPVGGGETSPWKLRKGYSPLGLLLDVSRDAANAMVRFIPFMNDTFAAAERIYVTSADTLRLVPARFHSKARIELAIGPEQSNAADVEAQAQARKDVDTDFRVLFAGRFVDYKGMHLGLPAFARVLQEFPRARLTMVGQGPLESRWRKLAHGLGIAGRVSWTGWQDRRGMPRLYAEHDVLLFPSLHDSGGLVVLEAMEAGRPVVCLKLGGPATMVDARCGHAIDPEGKSADEVVQELGEALKALARNAAYRKLESAAKQRCRDFSWSEKVVRLYGVTS